MCTILFVLLVFVVSVPWGHGFQVLFEETFPTHFLSSDQEAVQHKRAADVPHFFDQASFSFDGLTRVASVPVPFPLDICILQLPTVKYATALRKDPAGLRHFAVYAWHQDEQDYKLLLELPAPMAVGLDCLAFAGRGYIALSYNLTEPVKLAREGSPIYELSPDTGIRAVQYFSGLQMRGMYLRISSQDLTLLQAFDSGSNAKQRQCPYFKWMGRSFQRLGAIPCSNARRLEAFGIDYTDYVAVANYADAEGRTAIHSEVYRYDPKTQKFQLFQRLRSNGAVDVKYFSLPVNEVSRRHFLILGNTIGGSSTEHGEADTVIYVFEKGQFVPYQKLSFYALERFLPVQHSVSEKFLLLVACNKQDVKIYNLNDWRFEESKVQFTEGAFSRGVARMRSYEEAQQSYLVISNENMAANETNIFQPLFKQDEHANMLRQQIIDWAREQRKRLEQIDVDGIIKKLEEKLKQREEKLQTAHIKRVTAKLFEDPHMKLTPSYWKALQYADQALDVIEKNAVASNGRKPSKRSMQKQMVEYKFEEMKVDTLVVLGTVQAGRINGVDTKTPLYESIHAGKVYVSEEYKAKPRTQKKPLLENLTVQDLQLEGRLNQVNWTKLQDQTVKRSGRDVQFIKAAVELEHLDSEAVQVNGNEVSNRLLGQLIPVDGGDFIVQQDVQFAQPVQVNRLVMNQRLNHIHIDRQQFDLLLREANHTQVIEGSKRFENVRVMEPITIAGQLSGAELRAMTPVKVTHQSLNLQGDYVIDGDVTIGRLLQVGDLLDESAQKSAAETLKRGLSLVQPLQEVNLKFLQPVRANDSDLSFLNAQDLQNLVQLNVEEVQVVQGSKTIPQSVEISGGFGEVKWMNGVDVENLTELLLTKSGNQTVEIPIQIQGLVIDQVNSSLVALNGRPLEDYLQLSGHQESNATIFVNHLNAENLTLGDLNLNGLIFKQPLSAIYGHGSQSLHSWHLPKDFNGSIHAQNLWLNGNINQVTIGHLEQQLQQLAGNIKYVGDFSFGHSVNISSLSFSNSLNGIEADRFGRCWLETDGDQGFTAPQQLASLESRQGIWLKGQLNNHTLGDLVSRSYRLNASEHLAAVQFENPIVCQSDIQVGRLNGLLIPENMLYQNNPGYLSGPVSIAGDLTATGLCNFSSLNGYPLEPLSRYLGGQLPETFHAEEVEFTRPPTIHQLNGHHLGELLDQVWLDNEQIELTGVELDSSNFEGLLEMKGPINGRQVVDIKQYYFSRTRGGQQVKTPMSLASHDVTFGQPPAAKSVELRGIESSSSNGSDVESSGSGGNFSLDFNDFVANTLKTDGVHTVSGQWNLSKAYVSGNLNNVLVNQLNPANDVLTINKNNIGSLTTIDAPKIVKEATISRLYATDSSQVADVPIAKWINEAAYIYGNHSISGTTRLESVSLYNDLRVNGSVNGIFWQPEKLLLRDTNQSSNSPLLVANNFPEQQRIYSNNVENLWVDVINELPVNELLLNKAQNRPNLHVEGQLIFTQPLSVGEYEVGNNDLWDGGYKWKRGVDSNDIELRDNVAAIKDRFSNPPKVLKNMILQKLPHKSNHLEIIDAGNKDVLAIWDENTKEVIYYNWRLDKQRFELNSSLSQLMQLSKHLSEPIRKEWPTVNDLQFGLLGFQCLGSNKDDKIVVKCIDNQNKPREANISRRDAKQLLLATDTDDMPILLRTTRAVELWKWNNGSYTLVRDLFQGQQVEQLELIPQHTDMEEGLLAVLTSAPAAEITIYSFSDGDLTDLHLVQVLELQDSKQMRTIRFMHLPESKDLLLLVSNLLPRQSLTIFEYRGAAGFQEILGESSLPQANELRVIEVSGTKLVSLATDETVYILRPQFTTL
ncbi:uncharacterized protein clos [Drosophila bipectinata]|uniref:uncharacterized protein clos n=1 Tax=Drosophila bipectinata TaxID=42026 RepID=UPI001C8949CE|nr:uncharacterized protein LOC108131566 [Drosophila bipectinata]